MTDQGPLDTLRRHLRGVIAFPMTPFDPTSTSISAALRHNVELDDRSGASAPSSPPGARASCTR